MEEIRGSWERVREREFEREKSSRRPREVTLWNLHCIRIPTSAPLGFVGFTSGFTEIQEQKSKLKYPPLSY